MAPWIWRAMSGSGWQIGIKRLTIKTCQFLILRSDSGNYRVLRGGSWTDRAIAIRSASSRLEYTSRWLLLYRLSLRP